MQDWQTLGKADAIGVQAFTGDTLTTAILLSIFIGRQPQPAARALYGFGECVTSIANLQLIWLAGYWQCEHQKITRFQKVENHVY